jgi:tight adherence protein B
VNGIAWAATLLAAALVLTPGSPRHRVLRRGDRGQRGRRGVLVLGAAAAIGVAGIATGLGVMRWTTLAAGALAAGMASLRFRARTRRARAALEGAAMTAALDVLGAELRVGAHPVQAFTVAAADTPGPVGAALAAVAARAELGADVPAGLRAVGARSSLTAHWERLALAWQLAADNGLAIGVLVRAVHVDIVERQRFSDQLQAGMAGARATASILAALPVLGIGLGELVGAGPVRFLLGGGFGGYLLLAGTVFVCAGLWWADRITAAAVR